MKLSIELSKWRCDRPDEWKMDEFIRNAEKLEAERDALACTVSRLRMAIQSNCYDDPSTSGRRLIELANSIPQHHLAAHDAEVAANAIDAAVDFEDGRYCETVGDRVDMILDYARQFRAKAQQ